MQGSSTMQAFDPDVVLPITPPVTGRSAKTPRTPPGGEGQRQPYPPNGASSSAGDHSTASPSKSWSQNGTSTAYNSSLLGTDPVSSMTMTTTPRGGSTS